MNENDKTDAIQDNIATEASPKGINEVAPKKKRKKLPVILGVVAVVLVAAGAGFFVWHEQPSFCNAICHTPMDPYNETYEQAIDTQGVDKWGNEVNDTRAMMSVLHREEDVTCLECHVPTIEEQLSEGMAWISGNYTVPLDEYTMKDLTSHRNAPADEFCLNDSCHHVSSVDGSDIKTRDDLTAIFADQTFNPHSEQHGQNQCSDCHKAHRASVNYCSECHSDAEMADGWLTVAKAKKLDNNYSKTY